jgi:hypothetical protein
MRRLTVTNATAIIVARNAVVGVGWRLSASDRPNSHRARARLRKLAAGVGIAIVTLLNTSAAQPAAVVGPPGTAHFVDRGGPVLRGAQVYLLYWGSHWPATGIYFPTPGEITAAFRTLLGGPYLSGLAEYRGIGPAVLRGFRVVTTSEPHNGFDDHEVADFLNAQLDADIVPSRDPDNQTLYIVVLPVGISAGGDSSEFDGEHYYYKRHGQRIHFVWAAASGTLDGATRIISHELVESLTDPEGNAIRGVSRTCDQGGWCEIADICTDTDIVSGVAVSPYWSEQAHACVAPDVASTTLAPAVHTSGIKRPGFRSGRARRAPRH